jgi:hypothetical protein
MAAWLAAQFLWQALPPYQQFAAWTASQSMFTATLLGVVAAMRRAIFVRLACAFAGTCYLLSYGCSFAWLIRPFDTTGRGRCSDVSNIPVGAFVAVLALVLVWHFYVEGRDGH